MTTNLSSVEKLNGNSRRKNDLRYYSFSNCPNQTSLFLMYSNTEHALACSMCGSQFKPRFFCAAAYFVSLKPDSTLEAPFQIMFFLTAKDSISILRIPSLQFSMESYTNRYYYLLTRPKYTNTNWSEVALTSKNKKENKIKIN